MAGHDSPSSTLGHSHGLDRLRDRPDLVDLEQQRVDDLAVNGPLDARGVGDQHVVSHNLADVVGSQRDSGLPVVLLKGVLDGDDWVLGAEVLVELQHLGTEKGGIIASLASLRVKDHFDREVPGN